jgi:hypothetical protein
MQRSAPLSKHCGSVGNPRKATIHPRACVGGMKDHLGSSSPGKKVADFARRMHSGRRSWNRQLVRSTVQRGLCLRTGRTPLGKLAVSAMRSASRSSRSLESRSVPPCYSRPGYHRWRDCSGTGFAVVAALTHAALRPAGCHQTKTLMTNPGRIRTRIGSSEAVGGSGAGAPSNKDHGPGLRLVGRARSRVEGVPEGLAVERAGSRCRARGSGAARPAA